MELEALETGGVLNTIDGPGSSDIDTLRTTCERREANDLRDRRLAACARMREQLEARKHKALKQTKFYDLLASDGRKASDTWAAGVLQMRSKRAVADVRAALPLGAQHFDDALHPSPAGSDRIAEAVFQAIKLHGL